MDLDELKKLGETSCEVSLSADAIFCRHGVNIREEIRHHDPVAVEVRQFKQCSQCIVEMEILERLERIERFFVHK